ncbi:MAG: nitroreductase family protein [Methanomassiliicoccales archaeon]
MDLVEAIEKRCSVRAFTEEDVPERLIEEMLRLGNLAPSAGNLQSRDFIVVRDKDMKAKLAKAAFGQEFVEKAPVVVVCCANLARVRNYGSRGTDLYCLQDVAASVENMMLFLTSQGYGSCWVGAFDELQVAKLLGIPEKVRPVVLLPLGRPLEPPRKTPRLKMEAIVHREKW